MAKGFLSLLFVLDEGITYYAVKKLIPRSGNKEYNVGSVEICKSASKALDHMMFNFPDMIFIEDTLPDRDGWDLAEEILKDDPKAHLIMINESDSEFNVKKALKMGFKGYIVKPITFKHIAHYVSRYFKEKFQQDIKNVQAFDDHSNLKKPAR